MKIIIYHPQGNTNVRESVLGFIEVNILHKFHTSIAYFSGSFFDKIGKVPFLSEISRRKLDSKLKPFIETSPVFEAGRQIALKAGLTHLIKNENSLFSVESVTRHLDKKVAASLKMEKNRGTGVYAYEDGAYYSFNEAKLRDSQCFYDLPTGYWRSKINILQDELNKFPEWKKTIPGLLDSNEKLSRKDEELKLADCIFVASKFTQTTLEDFPGKLCKVQIIPYGFPVVGSPKNYFEAKKNAPIKLLFVGSLSQQKGIANLFMAVDEIGPRVSLTLVGQKPTDNCAALNSAVQKHRWIPSLPHPKVLQLMREHDVLIFPTLFDGFGLVITEAMSQGTPVIATYNSAGPDLIEHGKNGWLINAGSTSMLKNIIMELIEDPKLISNAGIEAMDTARKRPWSVFRKELTNAIKDHYKSI